MSAAELEVVLRKVVGETVPQWWFAYFVPLALILLSAAAAWLGSYMKEKGKRYATSEDLHMVVEELRRTTRATEEIKAEFCTDLWVKQRRRELRLEVVKELTTLMGQFTVAAFARGSLPSGFAERWFSLDPMVRALFSDEASQAFLEFASDLPSDGVYTPPGFHEKKNALMSLLIAEACQ